MLGGKKVFTLNLILISRISYLQRDHGTMDLSKCVAVCHYRQKNVKNYKNLLELHLIEFQIINLKTKYTLLKINESLMTYNVTSKSIIITV